MVQPAPFPNPGALVIGVYLAFNSLALWTFDQAVTVVTDSVDLELQDDAGVWQPSFGCTNDDPVSVFANYAADSSVGRPWRMLTSPSPGITCPAGFVVPRSGTTTGPPAAVVVSVHRTGLHHATWTFDQNVEANNPTNLLAIAGAGAVVAVNTITDTTVDVQYAGAVVAGAAWSLVSTPVPDINSPAGFVVPAAGVVT